MNVVYVVKIVIVFNVKNVKQIFAYLVCNSIQMKKLFLYALNHVIIYLHKMSYKRCIKTNIKPNINKKQSKK